MTKNIPYLPSMLPAAVMAAVFLSFGASPPAAAQQIFNGSHSFDQPFQELWDYRPWAFWSAYGEGQDAMVELVSAELLSGSGVRMAHSDGSGTHNTAVWNLDGDSIVQMGWDVNGLADILGYDGTFEMNVDGTSAPFGGAPEGNLRTQRVSMAVLPGSFATVNLNGPNASWFAWSRHIDAGIGGTAEINVTEGAKMFGLQRLVVGGTRWTATSGLEFDDDGNVIGGEAYVPEAGGQGTLLLDGPGSLIEFSSNSNAYLRVGRRSSGIMTVSNGAVVDGSTLNAALDVWVGDLPGGNGTLIVESGGVIDSTGLLRINSQNSDSGYVRIDGAGSQLNIVGDGGATSFIGNAADSPGATGVMEILNGGSAVFRSSDGAANKNLRIGNQGAAIGEVTIDGAGSVLEVGNFLQVGFNGTGTLNVTNGGQLFVGDEGTSFSAIGREVTGHGTLIIDAGTAIYDNSLYLASGTLAIDSPGTGTAIVEVRNGGSLEVRGNHLAARAAGSIVLSDGTIDMAGGGSVSIAGAQASLTGQGQIDGNLVVAFDGVLQGTGAGILVTGILSGTGAAENITLGGVSAVASTGSLTLNDVRFVNNAPIGITINNLDNAPGIIVFDGDTDLSGAHLMISFEPFAPSETWSAQLFAYTGPGAADYNFASVTPPDGWVLENGLLRHSSSTGPGDSAFDDWASGYGLSGADAAPGANPAGDGHTNLAKFAFGLNPTLPVPSLVDVSRDGSTLIFRWNRRQSGVDHAIESSSSLAGWTPVPGAAPDVMAVPDVTPPAGYERVEWSVDVAGEGNRSFYRVSADVDPSLLP